MSLQLLLVGLVVGGLVDPGLLGYGRWFGVLADESLGVLVVGVGEDLGPEFADEVGFAVVNVVGSVEADAAVPVVDVVPVEELRAPLTGVGQGLEPVRVVGSVLDRLVLGLAEGLSLEIFGLECDFVTPRSAIRTATDLAVWIAPRSEWIVNSPLLTPCLSTVSTLLPIRRGYAARVSSRRARWLV